MKKLIGLLLCAILLCTVLAGCGAGVIAQKSEPPSDNHKPRFTFINPCVGNPYWDMLQKGITAADKEFGTDTKCVGPAVLNADEQIEAIEAAIAAQVDGIITMALDSDKFTPVINRAIEAGIPVILADTDAPQSMRTAYIGTSNTEAGAKAGELLINAVGDSGKIAIITGPASQKNISERIEGFRSALRSKPNLDIVAIESGDSDLLRIAEKTRMILNQYPDITAIFCAEGYGAIGVGRIIKEKELSGKIVVIGFDDVNETIQYVREGIITATIVQKTYEMGYRSVKILHDLHQGKKIDDNMIYMDVTVVDQKNVDSYKAN